MAPSAAFLEQLHQQELLHADEPGSFANDSYVDRLPKLVRDAAANNQHRLSAEQHARLLQLALDLEQNARIPMPDQVIGKKGGTTPQWQELLQGREYTWHNAPWLMSEFYMFHLVLVISGYYETLVDPFHPTKLAELKEPSTWKLLQTAVEVSELPETEEPRDVVLERLIKLCLWGNKADGCYKKVKATVSGADASLAVEDKYLLVDHSTQVVQHFAQLGAAKQPDRVRVQWINDNCGTELLLDLALADYLLTHGWCGSVVMNVKAEPMYVSDACEADVHEHIAAMCSSERSSEIQALGARLTAYVKTGQLAAVPDLFWNEYKFYWEFSPTIEQRLTEHNTILVIIKGDLNLRRLLGDRMWPATTPLEIAVPYFPTSFVSFRTLKSNPIVGLTKQQEDELDREDPEWRFNGKRGTIMGVLRR